MGENRDGWRWRPREDLPDGLDAAADLTCIRWWCDWSKCWESGITSEPGVRYEVLVPPTDDDTQEIIVPLTRTE